MSRARHHRARHNRDRVARQGRIARVLALAADALADAQGEQESRYGLF